METTGMKGGKGEEQISGKAVDTGEQFGLTSE